MNNHLSYIFICSCLYFGLSVIIGKFVIWNKDCSIELNFLFNCLFVGISIYFGLFYIKNFWFSLILTVIISTVIFEFILKRENQECRNKQRILNIFTSMISFINLNWLETNFGEEARKKKWENMSLEEKQSFRNQLIKDIKSGKVNVNKIFN